ncbi:MAG: DUF3179 domain-containing (seleno)protein [Thiohalocapsa sp.]
MHTRRSWLLPVILFVLGLSGCSNQPVERSEPPDPVPKHDYLPLEVFYDLMADDRRASAALERIDADWRDAYAAMLLDMIYFSTSPEIDAKMTRSLEKASGLRVIGDYDPVYRWLWSFDPGQHPQYAEFMATIYAEIDLGFGEYFDDNPKSLIRLDEILWGGVNRDGIPPLKNPEMIPAAEAAYLDDDNIVFGVAIDGDARAYPKRILAWHEMVKDEVAGRPLTGVYCTLCGAMILYDSNVDGVQHELGTSGFLYRSNKLMYDHETKSLWSTLTGEPVVGPLVGKGIELKTLYVVTTTWKEWRTRHPDTLVLSLDTGRERDYTEGAAYRDYFATDRLMFAVPKLDQRLRNKAEVLGLRYHNAPLAISADFLNRNRVYHDRTGGTEFVVLTDPSGANRVYEAPDVKFSQWDGIDTAFDRSGRRWTVTESGLATTEGRELERLAAYRSFWFGWYSQFPQTRLVK